MHIGVTIIFHKRVFVRFLGHELSATGVLNIRLSSRFFHISPVLGDIQTDLFLKQWSISSK